MEPRTLERLVRPRVIDRANEGGEPIRIEDALELRLVRGTRGLVHVTGPPGAGKRTALAYVRLWAGARNDLRVGLDDAENTSALRIVAALPSGRHRHELELVPWGRDEWIEYLLARHRTHCAEVMARLEEPERELELRGRPLLWSAILDELVRAPELGCAYDALRAAVQARFSSAAALARARRASWNALLQPHATDELVPEFRALEQDEPLAGPFLAQSGVHVMLAAEHVAGELAAGVECPLPLRLDRRLLRAIRPLLRARPRGREPLVRILASRVSPAGIGGGPRSAQASAAGLLHLYGATVLAETLRDLPGDRLPRLVGAELEGLEARGLELAGVRLEEAHLAGACLDGAELRGARLNRADLRRASLCGAKLVGVLAAGVNLAGADLRAAVLDEATLTAAFLDEARFEAALLRCTRLDGASLRGALLDRADLTSAVLKNAVLAGASLVETDLRSATLDGVDLRTARLATRLLANASLVGCNLEQRELEQPDLSGADLGDALLTGSRFARADLRGARLVGAGLAHVEWPGANLSEADLSHASFHLGSARSGLVGAAPASWGTRTGFYSEELRDQSHRPPEELRKADLRRADLRGARIADTDFYLVDLRGAQYTRDQELHLRGCGAIL
jgi:uncharacterized protein YjbI with pentapeptide repeats